MSARDIAKEMFEAMGFNVVDVAAPEGEPAEPTDVVGPLAGAAHMVATAMLDRRFEPSTAPGDQPALRYLAESWFIFAAELHRKHL